MSAECPHVPRCRGLFAPCVTAWLQGPAIGSPESLRLGRLMHAALCPTRYCYIFGCHDPAPVSRDGEQP